MGESATRLHEDVLRPLQGPRVSYAVVGHEQRLAAATDLAHYLDAVVTIDDGGRGPDANHLKAWDMTATLNSEWCAVIEDDALPVDGFLAQAEMALSVAPAPVISLYLGKGKPRFHQPHIPAALAAADAAGAHWILSNHMLHAVAVAIRTELRQDWLDWASSSGDPIDQRMGKWCQRRGHTIAYCTPSLVNHADGPTLVEHRDRKPRDMPRVAWRTGTRERWNSRSVPL
ncbi:hypothetical protein [Nocardia aurea]|uniref:hypothetical protein n=1 Tax=Nocardia aurea TaxID=2144174 RepID=UPI0033BB2701